MSYDQLKAAIRQAVKANGNNEITGDLLQATLLSIVNAVDEGSIFGGVATQILNPRNQDPRKFYIAEGPGEYPLFGLTVPSGKIGIFQIDQNNQWYMETVDVPSCEIIDSLDSDRDDAALAAKQGKALNLRLSDAERRIPAEAFFPVMPDAEAAYTVETGKLIFNSSVGNTITFHTNASYNLYSISVTEGQKFFCTAFITTGEPQHRFFAFVDSSNKVVEASNVGWEFRTKIFTTPAGATKFYCTCLNDRNQQFSLRMIEKYRCFSDDMSRYKWAVVGDSLTDLTINAPNKYQYLIYDQTRIRLQNLGVGGTGYWREYNTRTSYAFRAAQIEADTDIITFFGSVNDWIAYQQGVQNGNPSDTLADGTLSGYMNDAIDKAMAAAPKAMIVLVSSMYYYGVSDARLEELCATLKAVAEYRKLPFVDMLHTTMFDRIKEAAFGQAFCTDYDATAEAYGHPSDLAHKVLIAPRFLDILNTYLPIRRQ